LFIIILFRADLGTILQNIKDVRPFYLVIGALFGMPILIIKSFCWNYLKKKQNIHYSFKDSFLMYGAGLYIGGVTPGRIGEVSRAFYLKKDGHSFGKSLVSIILERLADFTILLTFIFIGSLFLLKIFRQQILICLAIVLFSIFIIVLSLKARLIKSGIKKIFSIFIPNRHQKSWKLNFQDFISDIKVYKIRDYVFVFLITAISWIFYCVEIYIIAQSVNITTVPFLHLSVIVVMVGLITLIPISISGIGTRDAALILFLTPFLIPKEQIIVFSSLILLIYLFHTFIGFVCWLIKPI
jgi:glycosyltransferase 2 family protein